MASYSESDCTDQYSMYAAAVFTPKGWKQRSTYHKYNERVCLEVSFCSYIFIAK